MIIHQVFLDTSYIFALLNTDDKHNLKAKQLFKDLFGYDVTWINQVSDDKNKSFFG